MEELRDKEVYFSEYCNKCKHFNTEDYEDPCHECLNNATNEGSHKPVNYEES